MIWPICYVGGRNLNLPSVCWRNVDVFCLSPGNGGKKRRSVDKQHNICLVFRAGRAAGVEVGIIKRRNERRAPGIERGVNLTGRVSCVFNKCARACGGPTRNFQCAMVEKRENSLWLFNQPVVALGVVCLCSTASNKWISHWQTDVATEKEKKKKKTAHTKIFPFSFPNVCTH